jgi:hypothetical protein
LTDWYVRQSGSDSNGGTSRADAWRTVQQALNPGGPTNGDTVWIGAGVYREAISSQVDFGAETFFKGDITGANTGDAGEVIISSWPYEDTDTSDPPLIPGNFQTYEDIRFESGGWRAIDGTWSPVGPHNVTFRRCTIAGFNGGPIIEMWVRANIPANLLIDQCLIFGEGDVLYIAAYYHTANYDIGVTVRNSLIFGWGGGSVIHITPTGSVLAGKPGGGKILQSLLMGVDGGVYNQFGDYDTANKLIVRGCETISDNCGIASGAADQIDEDYNVITDYTPRQNVTAGTHSKAGVPPPLNSFGFNFEHERRIGRLTRRPFWAPRNGSALLGFHAAGSYTGEQAVDFLNRPRPAGGSSLNLAVGPFERHDTGQKETTTVDVGPAAIVLAGPANHDIHVPVQAAATTITIRGRFDTNHGTGTRPQVTRLASTDIGVTATTVVMTAAVDTWETLTIGPFTPTARGIVTLRLQSRPAAGSGKAWFDTVTVT